VTPFGGEVAVEPRSDLGAEGFLFSGEAQIHESNYERQPARPPAPAKRSSST
jgi:hypothetical protein